MATANILASRNKAVVAFLDGRRMKGYVHSFSAQEDHFRLFLEHDTAPREGTDVQMKDLKAIFFARDFVAIAGTANLRNLTRKVRAAKPKLPFVMGKRIGFFLVPTDPRSNNLRVFVIAKNATHIRWI